MPAATSKAWPRDEIGEDSAQKKADRPRARHGGIDDHGAVRLGSCGEVGGDEESAVGAAMALSIPWRPIRTGGAPTPENRKGAGVRA